MASRLDVRTDANASVAYSTEYSDKTNENIPWRQYKEGFGSGTADPNGLYRATWHVPVDAPAGVAIVHFATQRGVFEVSFDVADVTGCR